mmetsp:Transcript_25114/g.63239  ORF Transcript_25114/g.63239 Transcript_25114/m.63239 type:complete len:110 (-) Transcript_25114:120-449(-)
MYKRRDWLLLHGPDGGDTSESDSDSEFDQEGSDSESGSEGGSGDVSERDINTDGNVEGLDGSIPTGRMEDISEDDFDGDLPAPFIVACVLSTSICKCHGRAGCGAACLG